MRLKFFLRQLHGCMVLTALCGAPRIAVTQVVQPVIMEYKEKASGKLTLTNNTLEPLIVVLEPRSFSISPEGHGTFRALDPAIHVELSTMSVKLQPQETYYVFYKASADTLPAWFTIYATFSPVHHGQNIAVRIQLPHTVYLYQKKPLQQADLEITSAVYSESRHKLICDLKNIGTSLGRAKGARASGPHGGAASQAGFPMLPGMSRHLELDWKDEKDPPTTLELDFDHFTLRPPIVNEVPVTPTRSIAGITTASPSTSAKPDTEPLESAISGR
jgi:hypothetical protein